MAKKGLHQYSILTHIYGIQKDGNNNPVYETAKETVMYRTVLILNQCILMKLIELNITYSTDMFRTQFGFCLTQVQNNLKLNHSKEHVLHLKQHCSLMNKCVFCCLVHQVIVTIFLNSIYMCQYTVLVFFFLAYFTLYNRLQFHILTTFL